MDLLFEDQMDKNKRLRSALEKYQKTENDLHDSIAIIKEWIKARKQIPETPDDNTIMNFLLMNKFSIQTAKEKLEMYYSIRSILPEFFQNKHPSSNHMQESAEKIYYIPLPKVTEEGYRVAFVKFVDNNPENFQIYNFFAHTYNTSEVRLREDVAVGDILVYDLGNLKVGHFFKLTPVILKKTTIILEKVFSNRIKQIHILNSPKYAAATILLSKQLMKPKMASRIYVHKESQGIFKYIPGNIIPKDYGGEEISLVELNKLWKAKLEEHKDRFDILDKIMFNKRPNSEFLINDNILSFHGNFRKLNVD